MPDLHYSKYDVLAIMFAEVGSTNPTVQQVEQFDGQLFDANDVTLSAVMAEVGIQIRKDTKSTVLLYSRFAAGTLHQKIRRACRYFKNVALLP